MKKYIHISKKEHLFSVYECILLVISHVLIISSFLISPFVGAERNVLATITSLIGVWGIVVISKGNYYAHYIYIVFSILYSIVAISAHYYGEAIIYFFIMLPIHIFSVLFWKKNKVDESANEVKIKSISVSHVIIVSIITILLSVPFYYFLRLLKTDNLIISTLSLSTSVLAAYLMLRRVKFFSVVFAIDDLFLILLWSIQIYWGKYQYLPTLLVCICAIINDIYSAVCWFVRGKKRRK